GKVVVGVGDIENAIAQYRRAFRLPAPRRQHAAEFDADLAWFEGTPVVLAKGSGANSWLSRRVQQYGDAPVAFILTSVRGVMDGHATDWFGHPFFWMDEAKLGWRLGIEPNVNGRP